MNNFEKFKADLTVKRLTDMLIDSLCVAACDYCSYNRYTCENDCEFGVKKFLESEVEKECIDLIIKQSIEETVNEILEEYGEENIENVLEELRKLRLESEVE